MNEFDIVELLEKGMPFEGLADLKVFDVELEAGQGAQRGHDIKPDVTLRIDFGGNLVKVYGEIKTVITPRILKEIGPWFGRIKTGKTTETWALICPYLSSESQLYCQSNNINFIDLSGNVLIRITGKILIQRFNRPNLFKMRQILRNPFGGASSRVLRVLLQQPNRVFSITDIWEELIKEDGRAEAERPTKKYAFPISISTISKTIKSLEEELLVNRKGLKVIVSEPGQLLFRWAEKYRERYSWYRKRALIYKNPFGFDIYLATNGLMSRFKDLEIVVSGSAAANLIAPFVNVDQIDIYILNKPAEGELKDLNAEKGAGPDFLIMYPYDPGVALFSRKINGILTASDIQIYLDCYARGGRDAKQAEYILSNVIEKQWKKE